MKLILVRHGEPDYTPVAARCFLGQGWGLAPLTAAGRAQAEAVSREEVLQSAELIVSSPYTRALETAAVISKNTGIPLEVEVDLHEWLPDRGFRCDSVAFEDAALREFTQNGGERSTKERLKAASFEGTEKGKRLNYDYESCQEVAKRVIGALLPYAETHKTLIVVAHGVVIRQFVPVAHIPHCGIVQTDFGPHFVSPGFCPEAYARFL